MIRKNDILEFAKTKTSFSTKEVGEWICGSSYKTSRQSINNILSRMVSEGSLAKMDKGQYSMTDTGRRNFTPYLDEDAMKIENALKQKYPLVRFCVWDCHSLTSLCHHVPNINIIYVDVEKLAIESVFETIENLNMNRRIFLAPTEKEYLWYINDNPSIVIRQLISEAPLIATGAGSLRTSIEKILVDIEVDHDFFAFQGYESLYIYETAFSRYNINTKKMLRYARRRGCENAIKENIELKDTVFD